LNFSILLIFSAAIVLFRYFVNYEMEERKSFFDSVRIGYIKSFILVSFLCYLSAEILSTFNGFNLFYLTIFWGVINIVCFIKFYKSSISYKLESKNFYISLEPLIKWYLGIILIVIIIPLLFQTLFVPPNNWDSMTYHMSRVEHWRQNENVYPFPTGNIRQVIHNPLAEYIIANFQILSQTDYYANLVQFTSWIGILLAITLIIKKLNFGKFFQFVVGLLFISIPMGIYQSTTTQNDLLGSFFLVLFIYFGLNLKGEKFELREQIFLILSLLLGGFTKYTVFVFGLPYILYFSIITLRKSKILDSLKFGFFGIFFFILVFGPFLWRNYYTYGLLSGDTETTLRMQNASMSLSFGLSNSIKNLTDHFALPVGIITNFLDQGVTYLHLFLGVSKDNPGANFLGIPYKSSFILSENTTGSLIHVLFLLASTFYAAFNFRKKPKMAFFIGATWLGFFLYSLIFKWQPWQVRLMLPWMIITIIPVGILISNVLKTKSFKFDVFVIGLIIYSCIPVYFNIAKPFFDPIGLYRQIQKFPKGVVTEDIAKIIPEKYKDRLLNYYETGDLGYHLKTNLTESERVNLYLLEDSLNLFSNERKTIFNTSRMELYYVGDKYLYQKHLNLISELDGDSPQIQLIIGSDSYEYPLWVMLRKKFDNKFRLTWKSNKPTFKENFYKDRISNRYVITEIKGNLSLIRN